MTQKGGDFTPTETVEMLQFIVDNMLVKQDLDEANERLRVEFRSMLKETEHKLMDHTSREVAKVRGDLVGMMRVADEKSDTIITEIEDRGVITPMRGRAMRELGPFRKQINSI